MTGFGHSVIDTEVGQLSASVRSVNSRYLDIKIRGLNIDPEVERDIRQLISKNLIRGSVQIFFEIGINSSSNNSFSFHKIILIPLILVILFVRQIFYQIID